MRIPVVLITEGTPGPGVKERIFGITGPGRTRREYWWYVDATPTGVVAPTGAYVKLDLL